jgi:anti-sigma factor RsiW
MNCLNEGTIQTYIDQELAALEREHIERHLAECADCQTRVDAAARDSAFVHGSLSALKPDATAIAEPGIAYASFRAAHVEEQREARMPLLSRWFGRSWTPAWGALAIALVAILVGFSPARTWAERLLATLRVKRIAVVGVDFQSFKGMEESDPRSYKLLERAISDSVVVTKRPDTPEIVANSSAAAQLAGFRVRTLKDLSGPQRVQVNGEVAFHMTVDRDRLVSVLDEIGRPEIQIPEAVDGATLSVHIPKTVFSMYGDCKSRSGGHGRSGKDEVNEVPSDPSRSNCTLLVQAPSPSVTVPPDLNMSDVAEAGLQLAGMGAGEAHALCQTVDWTSTLVIPVPRDSASYQPVFVDGVEGTLIQMQREQNRYSLLWTKNGIIYSLNGNGTMNDALALAASLR